MTFWGASSTDYYDIVFEVRLVSGRFVGCVESDADDAELVADLQRMTGQIGLSVKTKAHASYDEVSPNVEVWKNGRLFAEILTSASFYRPRPLPDDGCRHCGTSCDLVNFAFVCPVGHGVRT